MFCSGAPAAGIILFLQVGLYFYSLFVAWKEFSMCIVSFHWSGFAVNMICNETFQNNAKDIFTSSLRLLDSTVCCVRTSLHFKLIRQEFFDGALQRFPLLLEIIAIIMSLGLIYSVREERRGE